MSSEPLRFNAEFLWHLREVYQNHQHESLLRLLHSTKNFESTDPRDKVFALIGLAYDGDTTMVDYNLSLNEVLISLARSLMSDSSKLGSPVDILSHAQGVKSSQTTPSWVPEWTFGRHDGPALVYSYPSSKGGTRKQAAWTIQPDDVSSMC